MVDELFYIRDARAEDKPYIDAYMALEGMDNFESLKGVRVAANADDECVGFIRIDTGKNERAHVNPVVVYSDWRGYGVGKALVEDAIAKYGKLWLVARGYAIEFYEKLGFTACGWDDVDLTVTEDCENCTIRSECNPLPMSYGN